jgi:hypothetical protein
VTLLLVAAVLVYAVLSMGKKIKAARSEAAAGYGQLPGESGHDASFSGMGTDLTSEMTDSVRF